MKGSAIVVGGGPAGYSAALRLRRGGMEISCEYAALVAQVRPLWEADVAQMLFQ